MKDRYSHKERISRQVKSALASKGLNISRIEERLKSGRNNIRNPLNKGCIKYQTILEIADELGMKIVWVDKE